MTDPLFGKCILKLARHALSSSIQAGRLILGHPHFDEPRLNHVGASFVTLKTDGCLRGCMGTLNAHRALGIDIQSNAFAAAHDDPRFASVAVHELDAIRISVSVLSPSVSFSVSSENDLLKTLVPFRDGLVLSNGQSRATFLPAVWSSLPEPVDFVRALKIKLGVAEDGWENSYRVARYTVTSFEE